MAQPRHVVAVRLADGTPVVAGETMSEGLAAEWQRLFSEAVTNVQRECGGITREEAEQIGRECRRLALAHLGTRADRTV